MTEIRRLLQRAETDAESVSALIRLAIFLALAAALAAAEPAGGRAAFSQLAVFIYGLATALGLLLAWRRIFHPVVPYLLATLDVILVTAQVLALSRAMGMTMLALPLPAAAPILVILIHASMRYRPWLVVYAGVLSIVAAALGGALFATSSGASAHGQMSAAGWDAAMSLQALPYALIGLSAFMLFLSGRRTRALLLRSITQARRAARLSRFFSPNLARSLAEGDDDRLLAGRRLPVAVLFIDIRGFTSLGEAMAPDELGAFLTEFRTRLTAPVFSHGGTVDKFIGDAIMAVFGTPLQQPDDARRALICALDIIAATEAWAEERLRAGKAPVAIGAGVHYGEVFAGALGDERLLEFTVIGDTVNVAERLEKLSRETDSPLLVSAALLAAVPDRDALAEWRKLPPQELKGHRRPVEAYCLVSRRAMPEHVEEVAHRSQ